MPQPAALHHSLPLPLRPCHFACLRKEAFLADEVLEPKTCRAHGKFKWWYLQTSCQVESWYQRKPWCLADFFLSNMTQHGKNAACSRQERFQERFQMCIGCRWLLHLLHQASCRMEVLKLCWGPRTWSDLEGAWQKAARRWHYEMMAWWHGWQTKQRTSGRMQSWRIVWNNLEEIWYDIWCDMIHT